METKKDVVEKKEVALEECMSKWTFHPKHLADQEVKVDTMKRRRFTAEYKLRILKEADLCHGKPGELASLLRKEGLYSSLLSLWRQQRDTGGLSAFSTKRGRKPKFTETESEIQRLRRENSRLSIKLKQAELVIELQKKVASILEESHEKNSLS